MKVSQQNSYSCYSLGHKYCFYWDANVKNKEDDKVERYSVLAGGVRRLHHIKTKVIPIVIGALGTVPKRLPKYLEDLGIAEDVIGCLQTTALLGTKRILRSVMSI